MNARWKPGLDYGIQLIKSETLWTGAVQVGSVVAVVVVVVVILSSELFFFPSRSLGLRSLARKADRLERTLIAEMQPCRSRETRETLWRESSHRSNTPTTRN